MIYSINSYSRLQQCRQNNVETLLFRFLWFRNKQIHKEEKNMTNLKWNKVNSVERTFFSFFKNQILVVDIACGLKIRVCMGALTSKKFNYFFYLLIVWNLRIWIKFTTISIDELLKTIFRKIQAVNLKLCVSHHTLILKWVLRNLLVW